MARKCFLWLFCVLLNQGSSTLAAQGIPTPEDYFGFKMGTERKLANWTSLTGYYEELAGASGRVKVDTLGTTTIGQPFIMVTVTSEENQKRLDELHEIQMKLSDPRRVTGETELEELYDKGKTVVLITHQIHATEVGGAQTAARLIHRLASSNSEKVREILDNVILVDIPSLNPDGTEWVANWYMESVGTDREGGPMPWLYHYYVGHDNNRDWYAFTQKETEMTVLGAHNKWHPHIVHDIHQMGGRGARIMFPPYIDPIEHNVDPGLVAAVNMLGSYMAAELTSQGKKGVVTNAIYDGFSPARAYQHYHGGARILSETASARMGTSVEVSPETIGGGREYDAATASANYPDPWLGGAWGLPDIIEYMDSGAMALLTNAAKNRQYWLENFYKVNQRAVKGWPEWPEAWVIPANQVNKAGLAYVLRILRMGDVEVYRADEPIGGDGHTFPAGSFVVPMQQPYASFAQTLLEVQHYPDLREFRGGPPRRPYDVTAHTLPLLMNVEAIAVETLQTPVETLMSGGVIATPSFDFQLPDIFTGDSAPKVGLYKSAQEPMEGGWTRWMFDQHALQYDTLKDQRARKGGLVEDYDVIVFQDQSKESIEKGYGKGIVPDSYAGGLGEEGVKALETFVREGGRVVAIEESTEFVIQLLGLEVSNAVARLDPTDFYVPGSILELDLDEESYLNRGLNSSVQAWYWGSSRAFEVSEPSATVTARYGKGNPLRSGWLLGPDYLAGKPAVVEIAVGKGSVVLIGFQPNYRSQSVATWPMLFNAMMPAKAGRPATQEEDGR
jgi:hypothetical protein